MTIPPEPLPRPPIVEAILAFEVPYVEDLSATLDQFHILVRDRFTMREDQRATRLVFATGEQTPAIAGATLTSQDRQEVIRLNDRSFAYHHLRPYPGWGSFARFAEDLWTRYVEAFQPVAVTELRLRYLNRIELPLPIHEIEDYVGSYPRLPSAIDTGMTGYLMQFSLTDDSVPARAQVTQRLEYDDEDVLRGRLPLVFDIEVSRRGQFPTIGDGLWSTVESLREYKNRLFFSSITDKTLALFR